MIGDINISIDLGNTLAKVGVFQKGKLVNKLVGVDYEKLASSVNELTPTNIIISTVNQKVEELGESLSGKAVILDHTTPIPIVNKYTTPETLGKDRLAAVVGAYSLSQNTNSLVIDIGTCITYDLINANNEYIGGSISPGIELKFKSLHNFTANLPLIDGKAPVGLIGKTTKESILSGVINGTVAEIEEIIRMYKDKLSPLRILICGGGAFDLRENLKAEVDLVPELVLIGLNRILEYNV